MANTFFVELLKQGVNTWNGWRQQHPERVRLDLSQANLYGAVLSQANLYGANLGGANLSGADLGGALQLHFLGARWRSRQCALSDASS